MCGHWKSESGQAALSGSSDWVSLGSVLTEHTGDSVKMGQLYVYKYAFMCHSQ